ncbi:MAG: TylF/MycF family methyltransferase [Marinovum sp.]|nr:TylF/MycF family methyltransferase [Marinovum sp.]
MTQETPHDTPLTLLRDHAVRDSFEAFKDEMAASMLFPQKPSLRKWAFARALDRFGSDGLYAEFGVWRGHGVNLFAKMSGGHDITIWGFDSFEGLEEDWIGQARGAQKGRYNLDGVLPEVRDGIKLVKGWVQDTVPGWLEQHVDQEVSFVHLDLDTYTPTKFCLEMLEPRLRSGSVILFDELYGYPGWRHHEYKALQEVMDAERYRLIGFSEQSVALEMV